MAVPQPNDVQVWLRTALEQNWSIRAASAAVAVTEKEVSAQRAGYYRAWRCAPRPANETGGSLFGGGSTVGDTRVTLNLSVPIFQSGYTYGMSHAAASRLGAASSELSLARRKVQRQVFSSFQNIVIGMDRIKALDSSVQSFELALRQKEEGFKAGLNDVVSVLDATRTLQRQAAAGRGGIQLRAGRAEAQAGGGNLERGGHRGDQPADPVVLPGGMNNDRAIPAGWPFPI